jgi:uncharacterized protein
VILANAATAIVRQSLISLVNKVARVRIPRPLESQAASGAIALIKAYQRTLSPWLGRQCLFRPSCSNRAIDHLNRLGWTRGMPEIEAQLCRCCGNFVIRIAQDGRLELETQDGCIFSEDDLSDCLLSQYNPATWATTPLAMLEPTQAMR